MYQKGVSNTTTMKNRSENSSMPFWAFLLFLVLTLAGSSLFAQDCGDPFEDKLELSFTSPSGATATHSVYFKGVT